MAPRLGISFGGGALRAVVVEQSRRAARIVAAVEVPLSSPAGSADDGLRLSEELRKKGLSPLPPAVVSLPPGLTFLRTVSLPVSDLSRAKRIHVHELEGTLPVDGGRFRSDVLPSSKRDPRRFLAVAALESTVRSVREMLDPAGIAVERIVSDHVACYGAFLSLKGGKPGFVRLAVPDVIFLETARDGLLRARHLPAAAGGDPAFLEAEWSAFAGGAEAASPPSWHGGLPSASMGGGPSTPLVLPGSLPPGWFPAFGAALLPSYDRETGAFALRGDEGYESDAAAGRRRLRTAVAASAVAALLALGALGTAWHASGARLAAARAARAREFQAIVPGGKVTAGELVQARGRLQSLEKQWKELGGDLAAPVATLSALSKALPPDGSAKVRDLAIEGDRLRVSGEARGSDAVERFRTGLVASFGAPWAVTVRESRGSARGDVITFTILVEKGGEARAD